VDGHAGGLTALVTGGSRGVGAATALALAGRGYDVAITYRNKAARAEAVAAEIREAGKRSLAVGGDMTRPAAIDSLIEEVTRWAGSLAALVLNASGGLERDLVAADPDYPLRINRDAQVALLERARPLLHPGSTVLFVTSHWAHRYGEVAQLLSYEPVAASKHAGELAVRGLIPSLAADGIRVLVATGDLIEGTITAKLLERVAPGLAAGRSDAGGRVASVDEMGAAIAAAIADDSLPSGQTIVVGGPLDSLPSAEVGVGCR
jgi:NAD(P)-dependent dehydrogenase (short-subunit alcohol dehydrogenase family)